MWKLLLISTVLTVAKAANIQDFYGKWVPVADYPERANFHPVCVDVSFEKSPEDAPCQCEDGRSLTLVKITTKLAGNDTEPQRSANLRVLAVDTFAEVEPALAVTCDCGTDRGVVHLLDNSYFMFYQNEVQDRILGQLLSKTVVSQAKLLTDIEGFEDLKGKKLNIWC